jgi:hypothetical protein
LVWGWQTLLAQPAWGCQMLLVQTAVRALPLSAATRCRQ